MRLKVTGRAGTVSAQKDTGQESRGGCLPLTGNVGWVGCNGCVAATVATVGATWGWGNLSSGLDRLDDSRFSWAGRTSLSWLNSHHLSVETSCSSRGSGLNDPLDLCYKSTLMSRLTTVTVSFSVTVTVA